MSKTRVPSRTIGIVHRVKRNAELEARPTKVCILVDGKKVCYDLEMETDELDFLLGRFPTKFRKVQAGDDLSGFLLRHIKWRKIKNEADMLAVPETHRLKINGAWHIAEKVPAEFDGLKKGDVVAMCLGGSGDRLAFALARYGQDIGAKVFRLAPKRLKEHRPDGEKSRDHELLAELYLQSPELFQEATPAELAIIRICELFAQRMDAMKARIECEQRLRQRLIGGIFLNEQGRYPEGVIEDMFDAEKASDTILQALIKEERRRNSDLEKAVAGHSLFKSVFGPIEGFGVRIAAPLIAYIGDIRRFGTVAAFKQYCGAAPDGNGLFQRKRRDTPMSWRPEIRQALFLFADQMNRRPDSVWGKVFLEEKARLQKKYPQEVIEERTDSKTGKAKQVKLYTKGHIHNKARWHALGRFLEWLYDEWTKHVESGQMVSADEAEAKDEAA